MTDTSWSLDYYDIPEMVLTWKQAVYKRGDVLFDFSERGDLGRSWEYFGRPGKLSGTV